MFYVFELTSKLNSVAWIQELLYFTGFYLNESNNYSQEQICIQNKIVSIMIKLKYWVN